MERVTGSSRNHILAAAVLILLTALAYLPAFSGSFVFDDHILIEKNPAIKDPGSIPLFFVSKETRFPKDFFGDLQSDIYRPLQIISYTVSHALWGMNASAFHIENVILHAENGLLVYFLIFLIFKRKDISFLSALLFLLHPVQVEAVTYLSGRSDVLSMCFYLLSLIVFIKASAPGAKAGAALYFASLALFTAGLLTKETVATLPIIVILYLAMCRYRDRKISVAGIAKAVWPYFLILAAFLILRTYNLGKIAQSAQEDRGIASLIMVKVFTEYLRLLIFPAGLTFFHNIDFSTFKFDSSYLLYFSVIAAFLSLCVISALKKRQYAFLLLAYLAALLPVSNLIPIKSFMQERFLYFPSVFILAFFAYALCALFDRARVSGAFLAKQTPVLVIIPVIAALTSVTFCRNLDWSDESTLVKKEIALHPEMGMLYFDLGHIELKRGRPDAAEEFLHAALKKDLNQGYRTKTYHALGKVCIERNDIDKAIRFFEKALEITPSYINSLNALGDLYFRKKEYGRAVRCFRRAAEISPDSAEYHSNLGTAYIMLGEDVKALRHWRRSLELNPDQPNILGYVSKAEKEKPVAGSAKGPQKEADVSEEAELLNIEGIGHGKDGDLDTAISLFNRAVELDPDFAESYNNLGFAYYQKGDRGRAEGYFRKALEVDPDHERAGINLKFILDQKENLKK
ncbi:tetratricopeptide repeat protein [Candidatus Omnitrophota bacterium]